MFLFFIKYIKHLHKKKKKCQERILKKDEGGSSKGKEKLPRDTKKEKERLENEKRESKRKGKNT